jgi:type III pantothenate kinase
MLLAVDVGNTNTKIALCDERGGAIFATWRISSLRDRMPDEWFAILVSLLRTEDKRPEDVTGVAISSVVPGITTWLTEMCRRRIKVEPVVLASTQELGLTILTENPGETGIDRVINGVAAFARFGGPVVIVDCGTATKFDVVSAAGEFVGGAIAPGLEISLNALAGRAARLYAVSLDVPERAVGTSTVTSIQSGVVLGYIALCEGMIQRILAEIGEGATVVATGGAADLVRRSIPAITEHVPSLTLDGIRAAYQRLT